MKLQPRSTLYENLVFDSPTVLSKRYEVIEKNIGEGSVATVSVVRKKRNLSLYALLSPVEKVKLNLQRGNFKPNQRISSTYGVGRKYALKNMDMKYLTPAHKSEVLNEINVLRIIDHPNIVKAFEVHLSIKKFSIIMELLSGGDLYSREPYTENHAARILQQLTSAVAYMHKKNIIHRDIKHDNILFESKDPNCPIKLVDFGLARECSSREEVLTDRVGSIFCMAPEVIEMSYNLKADMWSVGVVAYMLLSCKMPFWANTRREIADGIKNCNLTYDGSEWTNISEEAKKYVKSLLKLDIQERLSADQALQYPWLQSNFKHSVSSTIDFAFKNDLLNALSNFSVIGELQRLTLIIIAHKLYNQEIATLRDVFNQIDSSGKGVISREDFCSFFTSKDQSNEELNSIYQGLDVERKGYIGYTMFLAATLETQGRISEKALTEAFDIIDKENKGFISKEGLINMLGTNFSTIHVEEIMKNISSDQKISYDKFISTFSTILAG